MKKKTYPPRGKLGSDGLTDREREFARLRREDPAAPAWEIAKRAGFNGDTRTLQERGRALMKKVAVAVAVNAPRPAEPAIDPAQTKSEVQRFFRDTMREKRAQLSDRIKAADKLMSTVPGGYVPLQVEMGGKLTLETLVAQMGGSPPVSDQLALQPPQEDEKEQP